MFKRIYIEITNICNLSCSFCVKNKRKNQIMSEDDFTKIIKKIKPHTNNVYLHVLGEPTTHPRIKKFLDIIHENNLKANITTNGTLLNDNLIHEAVRKISISLHSMEKGSKNSNFKYVTSIYNFIEKASETIICELRYWNNNTFYQELTKPLLSLYNITEISNKLKVKDNIYIGVEKEFKWPSMLNDITNKKIYCHALKQQIAILVDGSVTACCLDSNGDIKLGNILSESLEDILQKDKTKKIIEGFKNREAVEELCKRCSFATKF